MVNAWSLAYDVINGTMDENFPVKKNEEPDDTVVVSTGSSDIENITIDTKPYDTLNIKMPDDMPSPFTTLSDNVCPVYKMLDVLIIMTSNTSRMQSKNLSLYCW